MTDQITLNADLRERTGTNKAREIRNVDGMVPAIVYGCLLYTSPSPRDRG